MTEKIDYPFEDIIASAVEQVNNGHTIYQKFTCSNCNARQHIEEPNRLYESASCEECGHVTDIRKHGCNYLLVAIFGGGENGQQGT